MSSVVPRTLRLQMVKPEKAADDAWVKVFAAGLEVTGRPAVLMLGLEYTHQLFPVVPAAGYWQCFWIGAAIAWMARTVDPRKGWHEW